MTTEELELWDSAQKRVRLATEMAKWDDEYELESEPDELDYRDESENGGDEDED